MDAFERMSGQIYEEFRYLRHAGTPVDPSRFLSFRELTNNHRFTQLVVSDAGVFFMDGARKIKYQFHPLYVFVYFDGLSPEDEEKIKTSEIPVVKLDNQLEFWKWAGVGTCLVADHANGCDYLFPEHRSELERIKRLYAVDSFTMTPENTKKTETPGSPYKIISLE